MSMLVPMHVSMFVSMHVSVSMFPSRWSSGPLGSSWACWTLSSWPSRSSCWALSSRSPCWALSSGASWSAFSAWWSYTINDAQSKQAPTFLVPKTHQTYLWVIFLSFLFALYLVIFGCRVYPN